MARERTPIHELKNGKETGRFLARMVDREGVERQVDIWKTKTAAQAATRAAVDEANAEAQDPAIKPVEAEQSAGPVGTATTDEFDRSDPLGTIADFGDAQAWPYPDKNAPRTPNTNAERVRRAARYLPAGGRFSPFDLTVAQCRRAQDGMLKAGLSPRVVDDSFKALSALAKALREDDYDVPNPAAKVRVAAGDGRIREDKLEMDGHHVVEREHLHRAVTLAPAALWPMFLTPATTSSRTGELLASNHREWDPDREMMYLHETIRPDGVVQPWVKGRRAYRAIKANRGRWVLWPAALQEMWLAGSLRYLDGYLIHSPRGGFWRHSNFYRRCWNEALKPAEAEGIPHFTPYDLRHTFATTLLEADVPKFVVAHWIGHDLTSSLGTGSKSDPGAQLEAATTLMKHYAHVTELWRPYGLSVVTALLLNSKMPLLSERPGGM
ncbi:tyrosine-type recombinase/integrase [Gaiella sp.]|uniref:tyrosine-type recombinase/integrase n=1 Tax=Gaiella sp. TaxID=2663207 RepID=UPI00398388C5